jgi:SMI1-KNR4 cell-wall
MLMLHPLLEVLTPPNQPTNTGSPGQWVEAERFLGTLLPSDYKAYIQRFGSGIIGAFIRPFNPFTMNSVLNLIHASRLILALCRSNKQECGDEVCPYPLFPEADGLLPWGDTINGDVLFWQTHGAPDSWNIVVGNLRDDVYERFEGPMTQFLTRVLSSTLSISRCESERVRQAVKQRLGNYHDIGFGT